MFFGLKPRSSAGDLCLELLLGLLPSPKWRLRRWSALQVERVLDEHTRSCPTEKEDYDSKSYEYIDDFAHALKVSRSFLECC